VPAGRPCRVKHLRLFAKSVSGSAHRRYRRSGRNSAPSEAETQTSKQRKLAHGKAAAEGSRREYRMQEGGYNLRHPWDFEARELLRANGKSPMAERRTSVNRSPCGRRTSIQAAGVGRAATLATVYPDSGRDAMPIANIHIGVLKTKIRRMTGRGRSTRCVNRWGNPQDPSHPPDWLICELLVCELCDSKVTGDWQ